MTNPQSPEETSVASSRSSSFCDRVRNAFWKIVLCWLAILLLVIGAFAIGVRIGEQKARHFLSRGSENRGLIMNRGRAPSPFMQMPPAHGAFGVIQAVSGTVLTVTTAQVTEDVLVTSSTVIRAGSQTVGLDGLHAGQSVSVIGMPNAQQQIEARLIRVQTR